TSRSTGAPRRPAERRAPQSVAGDLGRELRAAAGWAVDPQPAAERLDPIGEAGEPRAGHGLGAADPVVGHDDRRYPVRTVDRDGRPRRTRVLRDVRDRLRDEVVDRRLDPALDAVA